ncbi:permease YjgP/YjgQ family protein [Caldithrix abyssi DSM 13497]|uniref:Lipopolysaccharide export system permease protein n=1 Tax=Caldithrix abyssi DSM 13497 TaxID=880073 RepID=H1XNE3_CALAY|nr:LPS export ABC transporter permease LptG [Caldithrix abyssi]APF18073.1 lipopolysaccharide export system permease protein [Caldithrix abyssi DSM 13497]EHO42114.1 permease YjgP/YjgQ family protein [Caldithrix abyssi DSM 13497]
MINALDRHLIKQFIINLILGIFAWIIIFVIVDLIENISKFLDRGASFSQIFFYYIYYIPYIISLTLPVAVLLSTLFTISSMAMNNEIVAQLSSGISLYRILRPLIVLALLISVFSFFFNEITVPQANQKRLDIKRYQIEKKPRPQAQSRSNVYIQISTNETLSAKYYNGSSKRAVEVSIKKFKGSELVERIDAKSMQWRDSTWKLINVTVRRFKDQQEILIQRPDTVLAGLAVVPDDLALVQKKPEEMSYQELVKFIRELKTIGADPKKWIVEKHLKISLPFANFIVVLLGAPLASRKRRGGMGLNFGLSLAISFTYFIIIRVGQVLGHNGSLDPLLGAWLGNLIFLTAGLIALARVRK